MMITITVPEIRSACVFSLVSLLNTKFADSPVILT